MNDKLQQLQKMMTLVNESLSRKDFEDAFKALIEFIKRTDRNLTEKVEEKTRKSDEKFDELDSYYRETMKKLELDNSLSFVDMKNMVMRDMEQMHERHMKHMESMESRIDAMEQLPSADQVAAEAATMCYSELLPSIPTIEAIEQDLPKLGAPIRDGLELLEDGEKLKIEAIQDLQEKLDDLKKQVGMVQSRGTTGGGVGNHGNLMHFYDLSPYLDGVTKVFNIPTMYRIIAVIGSSFPTIFRPTTDWTHDYGAGTLTFTDEVTASSSLASGQTITIIYGGTA